MSAFRRQARIGAPPLTTSILLLAIAIAASATSPARGQAPSGPKFGGEVRLRGESIDNLLDLTDSADDSYQFWRLRYRFWVDAQPRENLRLYIRLGNEYRWGVWAGGLPSVRDAESRVSLDNGWAELSDKRSGLSLRFGRMDLTYGEGLLVFDGTPADGSSSGFFDAVRASWVRGDLTVDLFNAKLTDEGFGTPGVRDEDLYGLYARRRGVEGYVLHRFKRGATVMQAGKDWAIPEPRQRTTAIGARVAHLPPAGWQGAAEGAYQFGSYEDPVPAGYGGTVCAANSRRAAGGYAHGGWISECCYRPGFELGGLWLSGDRPGSARYEGWDDFYGEWPKWSELLIYTLFDGTTRIFNSSYPPGDPRRSDDAGAWTNMRAVWLEGRVDPAPKLTLAVRGMLVGADTATGPGGGRNRGTLLIGRADWTRWSNVAVQAIGEWLRPGDYYAAGSNGAFYTRFQITTTF